MSISFPLIVIAIMFLATGAWPMALFFLFIAWIYYNPEEDVPNDEREQ